MLNTLALKLQTLPLEKTGSYSQEFLDYIKKKPEISEFYGAYPKIDEFGEIIENRKFPKSHRQILVDIINEQYQDLVMSGKMLKNLTSLSKPTCFTVTTGHQLNIFTGPLYFIYKIITTVNACEALKSHYPAYHFVPVYWMASEDHDFAEINHFHLFGEEYQWDSPQEGAVGRFDTEGIRKIFEEMPECPAMFREAYQQGKNLSQATRYIVNELFGDYGLVVLDADHPRLKELFMPVIKDELMHHNTYAKVLDSSDRMEGMGYNTLVTPREINLFYLTDETRQRIVKKDGRYEVLSTDLSFSEKEISALMEKHPQCFSPNVVMRTLYQETILPNIAYVGGPGELSYWLQFKSAFDHYQIPFPVLLPRNTALVISKGNMRKFEKLDLDLEDLFIPPHQLKQVFLERNAEHTLQLNLEKSRLTEVFQDILEKALQIDGSLKGYVLAEETKAQKHLDQIEKRLKKSEEQKQEVALRQLKSLQEKLFPGGGLQERYDNFLNFYLNNPDFIKDLKENLDPFDFSFHILMEDG